MIRGVSLRWRGRSREGNLHVTLYLRSTNNVSETTDSDGSWLEEGHYRKTPRRGRGRNQVPQHSKTTVVYYVIGRICRGLDLYRDLKSQCNLRY